VLPLGRVVATWKGHSDWITAHPEVGFLRLEARQWKLIAHDVSPVFGQDVVWEIGRAAYFDANGISGRSLADKYYSANQRGDIDIE